MMLTTVLKHLTLVDWYRFPKSVNHSNVLQSPEKTTSFVIKLLIICWFLTTFFHPFKHNWRKCADQYILTKHPKSKFDPFQKANRFKNDGGNDLRKLVAIRQNCPDAISLENQIFCNGKAQKKDEKCLILII